MLKLNLHEALQWAGAVGIIAGHSLNAVGPAAHPFNIVAFFIGTVFFLTWTVLVANRPQLLVNIVALTISTVGLVRAFG